MTNLQDVLKAQNLSRDINKSLNLNSQISAMAQPSKFTVKSSSILDMMTAISKILEGQNRFAKFTPTVQQVMTNSIGMQSRVVIPNTAFTALTSITKQHQEVFGNLRSIAALVENQQTSIAQINNLQFALSGISGQVAAIAAAKKDWAIIDDFEEVTEKAVEFSNMVAAELEEKEQQRQFQVLLTLVAAFVAKHKGLGVGTLLVIDIILRAAGLHQYYDFLQEKPDVATQADMSELRLNQDTIINYIKLLEQELKDAKEFRTTNKTCNVRLKPNKKTLRIGMLPKDFEVVVVQVNHKWVLVNYFDPTDNLPQTGWIWKKYLDKP
jgi:hypothetical protein